MILYLILMFLLVSFVLFLFGAAGIKMYKKFLKENPYIKDIGK